MYLSIESISLSTEFTNQFVTIWHFYSTEPYNPEVEKNTSKHEQALCFL